MPAWPRTIADGVVLRRATADDAEAVTDAYLRNEEHLAPWEPVRPHSFFEVEHQRARLADRAVADAAGTAATGLLVTDDGAVVGTINLSNAVRGAFCSADLGYWIDATMNGRGLGTAAVAATLDEAHAMRLHRVQAGTLVENVGSQTVLRRNGFERIGLAPQYLHIAGAWRDHVLFQRLLGDAPPS